MQHNPCITQHAQAEETTPWRAINQPVFYHHETMNANVVRFTPQECWLIVGYTVPHYIACRTIKPINGLWVSIIMPQIQLIYCSYVRIQSLSAPVRKYLILLCFQLGLPTFVSYDIPSSSSRLNQHKPTIFLKIGNTKNGWFITKNMVLWELRPSITKKNGWFLKNGWFIY